MNKTQTTQHMTPQRKSSLWGKPNTCVHIVLCCFPAEYRHIW